MNYIILIEKESILHVANELKLMNVKIIHQFPILGIIFISDVKNLKQIKKIKGVKNIRKERVVYGF